MKLSKSTGAAALPAEALRALVAAWRFLGQPLPSGSAAPATVAEFWACAPAAWDPSRLPRVAARLAETAFRPGSPGSV